MSFWVKPKLMLLSRLHLSCSIAFLLLFYFFWLLHIFHHTGVFIYMSKCLLYLLVNNSMVVLLQLYQLVLLGSLYRHVLLSNPENYELSQWLYRTLTLTALWYKLCKLDIVPCTSEGTIQFRCRTVYLSGDEVVCSLIYAVKDCTGLNLNSWHFRLLWMLN